MVLRNAYEDVWMETLVPLHEENQSGGRPLYYSAPPHWLTGMDHQLVSRGRQSNLGWIGSKGS